MSNYRRSRIEGGIFFFTIVTYERQAFHTTPASRRILRNAIREQRERRPFRILAIVLLPDHIHTVWQLPHSDSDYSTRIKQIKSSFTRSFQSKNFTGKTRLKSRIKRQEQTVWQRRFYEHTCRDDKDLKRCIDYIHVNPLKHGLVERVKDWPWSSFHRYVKLGEYPINWGSSSDWYGDEFQWAE